jgi:hypothetical protein
LDISHANTNMENRTTAIYTVRAQRTARGSHRPTLASTAPSTQLCAMSLSSQCITNRFSTDAAIPRTEPTRPRETELVLISDHHRAYYSEQHGIDMCRDFVSTCRNCWLCTACHSTFSSVPQCGFGRGAVPCLIRCSNGRHKRVGEFQSSV